MRFLFLFRYFLVLFSMNEVDIGSDILVFSSAINSLMFRSILFCILEVIKLSVGMSMHLCLHLHRHVSTHKQTYTYATKITNM